MNQENANTLRQLAWQTFERDLPKLYEDRPGQWVAYQGDQIIGVGTRQHQLYQDCYARGLTDDQFVIFCIEPSGEEYWTGVLGVE